MNQNLTDITIVLDRSGSMAAVATDTIGGFNTFVRDQREPGAGEAKLTLVQFDDQYEPLYEGKDIGSAPLLDTKSFVPRGSTALLDAIAKTIEATGVRLKGMAEADRPSKVIFVIITDGYENASQKFTRQQVFGMITHQREVYKWNFVFLGANQDAIAEAGRIGIPMVTSSSYTPTSGGISSTYSSASSNIRKTRITGDTANLNWTPKQRKENLDDQKEDTK